MALDMTDVTVNNFEGFKPCNLKGAMALQINLPEGFVIYDKDMKVSQSGKSGDYLIIYSNGSKGIAEKEFFEDIYHFINSLTVRDDTEKLDKYGETSFDLIKRVLKQANAEWTSEGWVVEYSLGLSGLNITKLPKIKSVGNYFSCSGNQLTSLDGVPEKVDGSFHCKNNLGKFTEEDVIDVCDVSGKIYV